MLLNNSFDQRSEEVLVEFVFNADSLYGRDIYTSGMHELVHLFECTEVMGNMNGLCCFAFEELNRKVTRYIKGSDLIGDEFLKIWGVSLNLSLRVHDFKEENQFVNFIREYFSIKSSNLKYTHGKVSLKLGRKICVDLNNLSKNVKEILFAFVNLTI